MEEVMGMFIGLMAVIAIESLLIVFMVWKTPVLTFLKAAIVKKPLMYIIGKDRMGTFKQFESKSGAARIKNEGLFHLTENSHTLESGSKVPIYFAFRDIAATLLPEYPAIIQELREKGLVINNIEDIERYIVKIKDGMQEDLPVKVNAFKTYKFHDLENMFPFNLDPTFIDATVQSEITKGLKLMKMAPAIMGGIISLILVSAVAVIIIQKAFKGTMDPGDCQAMVSAAKCTGQVVQGVTPIIQTINTTPIIG